MTKDLQSHGRGPCDGGFVVLFNDLERPVFHVFLDIVVIYAAANQPLRVEDRILGVETETVHRIVTDTRERHQ